MRHVRSMHNGNRQCIIGDLKNNSKPKNWGIKMIKKID